MTTTKRIAEATPTKLRSGNWGARVTGAVEEGEQIRITTRSGKTWIAIATKVVWSGNGVSIVATESVEPRSSSYGYRRRSRSWSECGCRCGCDGESGGCRSCDRDCAQLG